MMLLTRPPVPVGLSWAQASPARRVLFGLAPVVLVGLVQAGLLLGLVAIAKVPIASPLGLVLFAGLGALAFAATNQALVSIFGGVGRLVSLAFALVEAAALAGLMPIETAPAAIQLLNGVLPLPQFVSGAAQLLLGGRGSLANACLVLAIWTVLAIGASLLAASRRSSRVGSVETVSPGPAAARPRHDRPLLSGRGWADEHERPRGGPSVTAGQVGLVLVLLGGVAGYLIVLRTLVATQNPLYVPSLLLLGSAVVPASVLVYAASGPRPAPVGAGVIAAVAGVGGVIGTVAAGTLEYDTLHRLGTVPMIMVGLIEESAKRGRAGDHPDLRPTPPGPGRRSDHRDRFRDGLRHPGDDGVRLRRAAAESFDRRSRSDPAAACPVLTGGSRRVDRRDHGGAPANPLGPAAGSGVRSVRRRLRGQRGPPRALGRFEPVAGPRGRGRHQLRRSPGRGPSLTHGRTAVAGAADLDGPLGRSAVRSAGVRRSAADLLTPPACAWQGDDHGPVLNQRTATGRPDPLDQSREPDRRAGGGARATTGTGADAARDLGPGWKISPSVDIGPGETYDLAVIDGTGTITHVWATTHSDHWRSLLLRAYWDGADEPAIEVPYGDFFSGVGSVRPGQLQPYRRQPERRLQLLLADAVPYGSPTDRRELSSATVRIYYQVTYELDDDAPDRVTSTLSGGAATRSAIGSRT